MDCFSLKFVVDAELGGDDQASKLNQSQVQIMVGHKEQAGS